jgi:1-acyl-sn-glycerol-3-phosphate acyltransferase
MPAAFYSLARAAFVIPRFFAIRETILSPERANRPGPYILAVSHISHLEPAFIGSIVPRYVRWMARAEYYSSPFATTLLNWCGAFSVDRFGNAAPAIRQAVRFLKAGEVVGIFPEGGVATGRDSVLRGAPIKGGVCTLSIATGVPVIPVVVLGTEKLNRVLPWLPTKSARVWIAFGDEIAPPPRTPHIPRKQARMEMTPRVREAFVKTYQDLLAHAGLRDDIVP